ncbi:MAG: YceI family protein [Thermomicrobiales bacterium]
MNRRARVGSIIGIPVVVVLVVVLVFLGKQNLLPGQTQPTAIPVTPFANIGATAPAGTTVAASTATTAPATAVTTAPTAAASTGNSSGSAASTAPAASTTASSASSSAATAPTGSAVAVKAPSGATTYAIAGDKSEAKVTVNEKLANLPAPSDAVLTTNAIQGQLFLGADTKPVEGAKIMVDLRTLKSDKTQRDNYIRTNTLQADQFPLAEYVVTSVDGWTGPLKEGQQSTFKLLGNMTIHGVTKPVTFDTTAMMQGGAVTGTATTNFTFEDFNMSPPNLTIVKANDLIKLDLNIVANKAG